MSREAKVLTGILVGIVAVMVGAFFLLNRAATEPGPTVSDQSKLARPDSHKLGTGTKVTLVEFGDYQCPACGAVYPNLKQLTERYQDRITLVFRNFPLPMHQNAVIAAEAAEAAGAQGKFWPMHDKLYETQNEWSESAVPLDLFSDYALKLGLNVDQFRQAVMANQFAALIKQDQDDGTALQIEGTPTLYLNGQQLRSYDYNSLKSAIDAALAK
jgi:protein-disulfide isomerase